MVEITEHQLMQHAAGYLDDAAKAATRHWSNNIVINQVAP